MPHTKEYRRSYYERNRERILARQKERAASMGSELAAYQKQYRRTNAQRVAHNDRERQRKRAGIIGATGETRTGPCPVCLREKKLFLDHDHGTGHMRGWLCSSCNLSLGQIGDTVSAAHRLVQYLTGDVC